MKAGKTTLTVIAACLALFAAWPLVTWGQTTVLRPPLEADGGAALFSRQYFGLHMHRAEAIRWPAVKFGSWRLWDSGISWADIERTPGQFDFARLDRYILMAERFKLEVVLPLALTPQWASSKPKQASAYGPGKASPPADIELWRRFVRTVANRYKGRIAAYELWNEANIPNFFDGDEADLAKLARVFSEEIRRADPQAKIIAPSGAGLLDPRKDFVVRFLQASKGVHFDAFNFHLYTGEHRPELMIPHVQALQDQVRKAGFANLPLWNTESGYEVRSREPNFGSTSHTAHEPERVAAYLVRAMLIVRALGVERFHWYAWDDGRMAMTYADFATPNPVGIAYTQLVPLLEGARLHECQIDKTGPSRCRLTSAAGRDFMVVWSGRDEVEQWTSPVPVQVSALDGKVLEVRATRVAIGIMPVVLESADAARSLPQP
ncbi:hypothetical protein GCM10027046_13840 [Uliginosibacterium flavum]|uniref:Glycosyl hydrolase n=1 Tax=Uliginosibacterium flavum TaxID=1396831 RepID=A0ABV2TQW2_9RHOO